MAKKGLTPSQIGVMLRDQKGIGQVKAVTDALGVSKAKITINDRGAVDCVIRARVETALKRAGGEM